MSSLFVKGMLLKSVDEANLPTRLKQRLLGENGDLRRLNNSRETSFVKWISRGNMIATRGGLLPLRAVLNPVSPPVPVTKKVCKY